MTRTIPRTMTRSTMVTCPLGEPGGLPCLFGWHTRTVGGERSAVIFARPEDAWREEDGRQLLQVGGHRGCGCTA